MCGRFTLHSPQDRIAALFELAPAPELHPRYNIAPSQPVAAIRIAPGQDRRVLDLLRWGLIPFWAKDPKTGYKMINARAETVASKPAFRDAFRRRRCLIPADGFYEWKAIEGGKQPYYIRLKGGGPFALAGLWEHWDGAGGEVIESCTIIVTEANELMSTIHDRMPVILAPQDYDLWLDPAVQARETVSGLLRPFPADAMEAYRVGLGVNSPRNDEARLIEPVGEG